jgi:hypothetical protein
MSQCSMSGTEKLTMSRNAGPEGSVSRQGL